MIRRRFPFLSIVLVLASAIPVGASVGESPVATITTPTALTGSVRVAFSGDVRFVSYRNLVLRVSGSTANVRASLVCRDASGAVVACGDSSALIRSASLTPRSPLVPGERYGAHVNPAGVSPITDALGNPIAAASRSFVASSAEQEISSAATYRWRVVSNSYSAGRSYRVERTRGASATLYFTGTSVTWLTRMGPSFGKALVYIDGVKRGTVNNYSSRDRYQVPRRWTGLSSGRHRLTIVVLDEKGARAARATWVAVDGWRVGSTTLPDTASVYRWDDVATSAASGNRYRRTRAVGARVSFVFRGRGIDWYATTGPDQGYARVYIDGRLRRTVDLYSSSRRYHKRISFAGLSDAKHTMTIVAVGRGNSRSRGVYVSVDRWILRLPSVTMFRGLGAWIDLYDYGSGPGTSISYMRQRGVKTLYIQTARWNSDADIVDREKLGAWLEAAHAAGMKVVAWYLPAYDQWLDRDVRRSVAMRTFRSENGHAFDAIAIDIEFKGETETRNPNTEFNQGIVTHLARVRSAVGNMFPVGAITPAPVGMAISPSSWTGFPWASIGRYTDIVMPMAYSSYRLTDGRCPVGSPKAEKYCTYRYTVDNIKLARSYTSLPVHNIGGVARYPRSGSWYHLTPTEMGYFAEGCDAAAAYGCSVYDFRTMVGNQWPPLASINS